MFLGAAAIITRIMGILGIYILFDPEEGGSIYGMETSESYSALGLLIIALVIFKGITAFGMWTEKNWAIKLGIIDAIVGIAICIIMMFILPMVENEGGMYNTNFRFELLLLIPYLIICFKIKKKWEEFESQKNQQPIEIKKDAYLINIEEEQQQIEPDVDTEKKKDDDDDKLDKEDHRRFMPK